MFRRMAKKKNPAASPMAIELRVNRLTREVEQLVIELRALPASKGGAPVQGLLAPAVRSLEHAVNALRAVADDRKDAAAYADLRAYLEVPSGLMTQLGSRVVLAGKPSKAAKPSSGAQALALLLEAPGRAVDAQGLARHLACSVPMARTTLNRLVQSGHAVRAARGRFRAKAG
jgi:hypothetical protein